MELQLKPTRVKIYVNTKAKTAAQVKAETGCDAVINGGVFNKDWTPGCWLKVEGKRLASEDWKAWGYGWNNAGDLTLRIDDSGVENFINCVCLVQNGLRENLIYPEDMGGARQRTAWAVLADGTHLLYCDKRAMTPESLQDYFLRLGVKHALMLDGGGSTQCIFPAGSVTSSRKVHNFICFYSDEPKKEEPKVPEVFAEPTEVLRKGAKGKGVQWLQLKLNDCGYLLDVDGEFGTNTYNAVVAFQDATSLSVDGVAGENTRAMLKRVADYRRADTPIIAEAIQHIGVTEPNEDDVFITEYNTLAGTKFALSAAWCQMFVVVMQARVNMNPYLTASCTAAREHYKTKNLWSKTAVPGDLIYFDWDLSGDCDHVGIVAGVEGDTIYTIEGNASGKGADGIRLKSYKKTDARIAGYANITADTPEAETPCGVYFSGEAEAKRFVDALKTAGFNGAFYRNLD